MGMAHAKVKIQKIKYGKSFGGRDLVLYKIFDAQVTGVNKSFRQAVIITEGIHGNEYVGIVQDYIDSFNKRHLQDKKLLSFVESGGILYLAPNLNPDSVKKGRRLSSLSTDMNRDFAASKLFLPESYHLTNWIDKDLKKSKAKLSMAIDYHCCAKSLIHPEHDKGIIHHFHGHYQRVHKELEQVFSQSFKMGISRDIFGQQHHGTLKDYWFKKYQTLSFTFELEKLELMNKEVISHFNWWSSSLEYIAKVPVKKPSIALVH